MSDDDAVKSTALPDKDENVVRIVAKLAGFDTDAFDEAA